MGVCGGFQILGERLVDTAGVAGDAGDEPGLGLLPVATEFHADKIVRPVTGECGGRRWPAYEIHMGRTTPTAPCAPLHTVWDGDTPREEGVRCGRVWGTYLHGWFESPAVRAFVAEAAGFAAHRPHPVAWPEKRRAIYDAMADHVAAHADLSPLRHYLGL